MNAHDYSGKPPSLPGSGRGDNMSDRKPSLRDGSGSRHNARADDMMTTTVSRPQRQAMIDHCRDEIRHESGLLIGRLNALLSTQAFLVIAYASSLGSANGAWRQPFTILLPPLLAVVGLVLAWEARRGLSAARRAIVHWQSRIDELLENEAGGFHLSRTGRDVAMLRRDGDLFTRRTPWIFMASWIWLAALPFYLFLA